MPHPPLKLGRQEKRPASKPPLSPDNTDTAAAAAAAVAATAAADPSADPPLVPALLPPVLPFVLPDLSAHSTSLLRPIEVAKQQRPELCKPPVAMATTPPVQSRYKKRKTFQSPPFSLVAREALGAPPPFTKILT